jgi:hypothetical protein
MMVGVTDQDTEQHAGSSVDDAVEAKTPNRKRRIDKTLLIVSLFVGLGLALMVRGLLVGITGEERSNLPELIEQVDPVPESVQVLSQTNVFVDLTSGYTGVLVIDGIEIETVNLRDLDDITLEPGRQVDLPSVTIYEPGNATLTFTPSSDALISEFSDGEHRAKVIYWRVEDGRQRARSYAWTFNVV